MDGAWQVAEDRWSKAYRDWEAAATEEEKARVRAVADKLDTDMLGAFREVWMEGRKEDGILEIAERMARANAS